MFHKHVWTNNLFKYHDRLNKPWEFSAIGLPRIFSINEQKHILFCAHCGKLKDFGITKTSSSSFVPNYPKSTVDLIDMFEHESRLSDLYQTKYPTNDVNLMNERIREYRKKVFEVS